MAFTFAAFAYIVALIFTAFLVFFVIYHIISFDELKTDYKNPMDQCDNLNPLVLPEYIMHILFTLLFLFSMEWTSFMMNLPLAAYNINRYINRPVMRGPGLYDPTTIMNGDELRRAQKEGWIKLVFFLLSFFYYLYSEIDELKLYLYKPRIDRNDCPLMMLSDHDKEFPIISKIAKNI